MEKTLNEVVKDLTDKIHLAEISIKRLEEQGERRIEARMREQELQARILEAQTKWRPKDWFILTSIVGGVVTFICTLISGLILAFSYIPPTTSDVYAGGVAHIVETNANNGADNNANADLIIK